MLYELCVLDEGAFEASVLAVTSSLGYCANVTDVLFWILSCDSDILEVELVLSGRECFEVLFEKMPTESTSLGDEELERKEEFVCNDAICLSCRSCRLPVTKSVCFNRKTKEELS